MLYLVQDLNRELEDVTAKLVEHINHSGADIFPLIFQVACSPTVLPKAI